MTGRDRTIIPQEITRQDSTVIPQDRTVPYKTIQASHATPPVVSQAASNDAEAGVGEDPAGPNNQQDVRHRGVVLAVELHIPHPAEKLMTEGVLARCSRGGLA